MPAAKKTATVPAKTTTAKYPLTKADRKFFAICKDVERLSEEEQGAIHWMTWDHRNA